MPDPDERPAEGVRGRTVFIVRHVLAPTLTCLAIALLIEILDLDRATLDLWYDPVLRNFPGAHSPLWEGYAHDGGDRLVIAIGLGALAVSVAGGMWPRLRPLRRDALLVLACVVSGPALVALAKQVTNVDCPFALSRYGGTRPDVRLLEDRQVELPRAACFPAAHSAGAFTLFGFYFAWRGRHPRRARLALAVTLLLGTAYAVTQWVRGSHFPSHDLWSAWLVWMICLGWSLALRHERV